MPYKPGDNYCDIAKGWQAVPSEDSARAQLESWGNDNPTAERISDLRVGTKYPCDDSYSMGTIQDDHIFVSTTDSQHSQIVNGQEPTADCGVSGYFTDQATVDNCTSGGVLDNSQLNQELQVAPFQASATEAPAYKPHIDCFNVNPDALEANYGTRDFNAAIAKCEANNQFGEGGGNQGFNPNLSEMMANGSLEYDKDRSFSDRSISNPQKCDPSELNSNPINNSLVDQDTYNNMMQDAKDRAQDCVNNNTEHPSQSVNDATGYTHNENPVEGSTGNATPVNETRLLADGKGDNTSQNNNSSPDNDQNYTGEGEKLDGQENTGEGEETDSQGNTGEGEETDGQGNTGDGEGIEGQERGRQEAGPSEGMPNDAGASQDNGGQEVGSSEGMPNDAGESQGNGGQEAGSSVGMPNDADASQNNGGQEAGSSKGMPNDSGVQASSEPQEASAPAQTDGMGM